MNWLTILSPFLAAALASYLTYLFATRSRRREVVTTQRLEAFKSIHSVLVKIRRDCQIRVNGYGSSDYDIGHSGEAPYDSPLEHYHALDEVLTHNSVFLPLDSDEVFERLRSKLSLAMSFQEWVAAEENPDLNSQYESALVQGLENIITTADECATNLHRHLGLH